MAGTTTNPSGAVAVRTQYPPLFIVGCPRTGTTLVSQMLDSHSRIAVYHETNFFPVFLPGIHRYGNLRRSANLNRLLADIRETIRTQAIVEPPEIDEMHDACIEPTFEGVFATLLQLHARKQGKSQGGDKTPGHHAYVPEILERFPNSPIIFVMRDPRDTVLSIKKTFGATTGTGIRMWNEAFMSYWQAKESVHLVRYEELVENPEEVVGGICAYLGAPYEPAMLRFAERVPDRLRSLPKIGKLLGPVDAGSVGNFQRMPLEEIEKIESACAFGMSVMGYAFTTAPAALEMPLPQRRNRWNFFLERSLYYLKGNPYRWRQGYSRWKITLRVHARYLLALGPLRRDW